MTSNIGSHIILENTLNSMLSEKDFENTKEQVNELMKAQFKPEFLNRIEEIVFFKALTLQQLKQIVDIYFKELTNLFAEKNIVLSITDDAKELIATRGFNPIYGARPLKRTIRQLVENPLAKKLLSQDLENKIKIVIDTNDDEIIFR